MNKLKHIVFSVAKVFVIILSVLSLLLVIFALGKPEKLTTQIGTIFGPMLLPLLIISLVILTGASYKPQSIHRVRIIQSYISDIVSYSESLMIAGFLRKACYFIMVFVITFDNAMITKT